VPRRSVSRARVPGTCRDGEGVERRVSRCVPRRQATGRVTGRVPHGTGAYRRVRRMGVVLGTNHLPRLASGNVPESRPHELVDGHRESGDGAGPQIASMSWDRHRVTGPSSPDVVRAPCGRTSVSPARSSNFRTRSPYERYRRCAGSR
jgi:hypothetical protein